MAFIPIILHKTQTKELLLRCDDENEEVIIQPTYLQEMQGSQYQNHFCLTASGLINMNQGRYLIIL